MERNDLQIATMSFGGNGYTHTPVRKSTCSDYFLTSLEVMSQAKNFVVVLSQEWKVKKISRSLSEALGYSEDELLVKPFNSLLDEGSFVLKNQSPFYYFESKIRCKGDANRHITWRLIPDLFIDAFVFVGWETCK